MALLRATKRPESRTLTDFPEYTQAREKVEEIQTQRGEIETKIKQLKERQQLDQTSELDLKARAILTGEQTSETSLRTLEGQSRVLQRAAELADEKLREVTFNCAREIAKDNLPEFRRLLGNVVTTIKAEKAAFDEYQRFIRSVASLSGHNLLPQINVNPQIRKQFDTAAATFLEFAEANLEGRFNG